MKCAGLYVRVSTEAQAEEGFSIEAQKERLLGYCQSKGWDHYEFFIDGGFSGSHLERPEMNRLISAVKEGELSSVLVYKLDRLSRSQKDTLYLIEDVFLPQNVDFISLNESIDTSSPYGRAMIGILSAFAQLERENIYLRTRMGMVERVKQGYWMGGGTIPFGYDYDKEQGILVPHPREGEVVRQIYQLYIKGFSPQKIADKLGLGYDRLVTQIIDRRSNLGLISYRGEEYQGKHEALVSKELYEKAQERRRNRQVSFRASAVHLLSGLIYCKNCGNRLRYQQWGKGGYKLRCYSLDKSKAYMSSGKECHAPAVWARDVEEIVEKDLLQISLDFQGEKEDFPSIAEVILQEITVEEGKLKRLYQLFAKGEDKVLLDLIQGQRDKIDKLNESLAEEKLYEEKGMAIQALKKKIWNLGEVWGTLSLPEKQSILQDCIYKIEIYEKDVSIFYNFLLGSNE
ncbi:MAG: recombinase family protein [Eubacteriales bacterium]